MDLDFWFNLSRYCGRRLISKRKRGTRCVGEEEELDAKSWIRAGDRSKPMIMN